MPQTYAFNFFFIMKPQAFKFFYVSLKTLNHSQGLQIIKTLELLTSSRDLVFFFLTKPLKPSKRVYDLIWCELRTF